MGPGFAAIDLCRRSGSPGDRPDRGGQHRPTRPTFASVLAGAERDSPASSNWFVASFCSVATGLCRSDLKVCNMVSVVVAAVMWVLVLLSFTLLTAWAVDTLCSWPSVRMMLSNTRRLAFGRRTASVEPNGSIDRKDAR